MLLVGPLPPRVSNPQSGRLRKVNFADFYFVFLVSNEIKETKPSQLGCHSWSIVRCLVYPLLRSNLLGVFFFATVLKCRIHLESTSTCYET